MADLQGLEAGKGLADSHCHSFDHQGQVTASPSPHSSRKGDRQLSQAAWGRKEPQRPAPSQGPAQDALLHHL